MIKQLFASLFLSIACTNPGPPIPDDGGALVWVYEGGNIYLDAYSAPVDELSVSEGRVVGWRRGAEVQGRRAQADDAMVHLNGKTVVPGLQDAHGHVQGLGALLANVDLAGSQSYAEVIERIVQFASTKPKGTWITGRGWDQTLWPGGEFPNHAALSEATPDHPVLVRRVDGHAALANARALKLAGLFDADPIPTMEGGRVVLDDSGRPSGVLIDTAMGLVARMVPGGSTAEARAEVLAAQKRLLSLGVVAVHDMGMGTKSAELLSALEDEGILKLRVLAYLWGNDGLPAEVLETYPRARDRNPAAKVRVRGVKLMMDGALGSRGAALLEAYSDAPGELGLLRMEHEAFAARVNEMASAGLQPATHAIGDRANRIAIDVYAERLASDPAFAAMRPRIEHAQIVSRADWPRLDQLGIVLSMQPTHATSDMRWAEERVGPERVLGAYAWQRLTEEPRHMALGSDFPVEPADPLLGLYAARTRMDRGGNPEGGWQPDQRLSGQDALAGFTMGAAYAVGEEAERGQLGIGFRADMTILDVDPVTCAPEELLSAEVIMTVIDGVIVYRR